MTRRCSVTGIMPLTGNNVSHANNKTKRRFLPNLHKRKFWHPGRKQFIRLRVSTRGIRMIDKYGIEAIVNSIETGSKIKSDQALRPTSKPSSDAASE